jgi:hypothetical protein
MCPRARRVQTRRRPRGYPARRRGPLDGRASRHVAPPRRAAPGGTPRTSLFSLSLPGLAHTLPTTVSMATRSFIPFAWSATRPRTAAHTSHSLGSRAAAGAARRANAAASAATTPRILSSAHPPERRDTTDNHRGVGGGDGKAGRRENGANVWCLPSKPLGPGGARPPAAHALRKPLSSPLLEWAAHTPPCALGTLSRHAEAHLSPRDSGDRVYRRLPVDFCSAPEAVPSGD